MADDTQKIALVTGANKGIGFEIARQLGAKGVSVLVGARDPEKGQKAVKELRAKGLTAEAIELDVTDQQSVDDAAAYVHERYGRLDILVNNAGIGRADKPYNPQDKPTKPSEMPLDAFTSVFDTNFYGPIRVIKAFLPMVRQSSAGRIVNISSTLGSLAKNDGGMDTSGMAPYNASKSALNRLLIDYATELADTQVKINNICPGYVATDLNNHSGPRTPEQGARIAVDMALLPANGPTGTFQDENGVIPW